MAKRSKDRTEPWVWFNGVCEFVYFTAWQSMSIFQCCHVQFCGHSPFWERKRDFLIKLCLSL
jgi:hypothetical protein